MEDNKDVKSEEHSDSASSGLLGTLTVRFDGNINSVDIESKNHFYYSNIEGMYKTGNGYGLQTNHLDIENEIKELCHNISDAIYKFTKTKKKQKDVDRKSNSSHRV